jgi:hypothetical protein
MGSPFDLVHERWFTIGCQPGSMDAAGNGSLRRLPAGRHVGRNAGYIESVCKQLNGCFRACYYDAASVMLRRLMETLIIEAYEHLKRDGEIKDGDGNYFMLKHLSNGRAGNRRTSA